MDTSSTVSSPTYALAAAASPAVAIQIGPAVGGMVAVKLFNSGTVFAFVSYAATAALALSQCVLPVAGTPQQVVMIGPGEDLGIQVPAGQYWTAGAASASAVYVQFFQRNY